MGGTVAARAVVSKQQQEVLAQSAEAMRDLIASRLRGAGMGDFTDDVVQDTFLAAVRSWRDFDETRGSVQAWVNGIAQNQVSSLVRSRAKRSGKEIAVVDESGISLIEAVPDPADAYTTVDDRVTFTQLLDRILGEVRRGVVTEAAVDRAVRLWVNYDGDTSRAATALGLTVDQLADSRRNVQLTAHVVWAAICKRDRYGVTEATLRDLLDCLPTEGDAGSWTQTIALICARRGRGIASIRPEDVVAAHPADISYSTARQYLRDTQLLLAVARTIIEKGTLE